MVGYDDIYLSEIAEQSYRNKESYLLFCDVESTGLDYWRNDIVSLCMIATDHKYNILGEFYEEAQPIDLTHVSEDALKVNGFTLEYLLGQQTGREMAWNMIQFLRGVKPVGSVLFPRFIYHANKGFDFVFLDNWCMKLGAQWFLREHISHRNTESTLALARSAGIGVKREGKRGRSYSLDVMAQIIGFDLKHHDARSDTRCTMELHKYLTSRFQ